MNSHILSNSSRGFVLPIALGFGLVMLLIGVSTILFSQSDKQDAFNRKVSVRSLNVAETGIARLRAFLGRYPEIASYSLSSWNGLPSTCPQDAIRNNAATAAKAANWVTLANDPNQGRYRLVDYIYNNGEGSLTVDGQINPGKASEATTRVEVQIPVLKASQGQVMPGLWIANNSTQNIGNDKIRGDIVVNGCNLPPQPTAANIDNTPLPPPPPPAPPFPAPNYQVYAIPQTFPPRPNNTGAKPLDLTSLRDPLTGLLTLTLPQNATDPKDPSSGRYQYQINNNLDLNSGDKILIDTSIATAGVDLFVLNDITLNNGSAINATGQASALRIIGLSSNSVSIDGNAVIKALVDARNARGGVIGGGSVANVRGSLWLKDWTTGSAGGTVKVIAEGNFAAFGLNNTLGKNEISVVQHWNRQQIP